MEAKDFTWRWHDRSYVDGYVRFTRGVEFDGAEWARRLHVGSEDTVVDLGCGEGKLILALAPYIKHGIGVDLSTIALDYARRRIAAAGVHNIELIEQDFRRLTLPAGTVSAFVSLWALHHVSDETKAAILTNVKDALRPGGLLHIEDDTFNFPPERFDDMMPAMYREFEQRLGAEAWKFLRTELAGEDFECTPYLESLLSLIRSAGFELIEVSELGLNGAVIRARRAAAD